MSKVIAIIEDDEAIRDMYRIKFESENFKVVMAENGKRGLALAEKEKPDIILLDIMMPEMTGDAMLKKMRATDWGKDIKVIILTNVSKDEAFPLVKDYDVDDFVIKAHYTPQEVVDTVKKIINQQ